VGATRSDIDKLAAAGADHAAAGNTDHPNVERANIGLVAADARIFDSRPPVADHADIGAGAADLEINAVGHAQIPTEPMVTMPPWRRGIISFAHLLAGQDG
jgi:hypothetical protein